MKPVYEGLVYEALQLAQISPEFSVLLLKLSKSHVITSRLAIPQLSSFAP